MGNKKHVGSFVWAVALPILLAGCATGGTGGVRLELADEGSFFVNGQSTRSEYPGASLRTDHGIAGNSHMMMMDKNNLQVAGVIRKWITDNVR